MKIGTKCLLNLQFTIYGAKNKYVVKLDFLCCSCGFCGAMFQLFHCGNEVYLATLNPPPPQRREIKYHSKSKKNIGIMSYNVPAIFVVLTWVFFSS